VEDPGCVPSGRFGLKSYNTGAQWRNVAVSAGSRQDLVAMIGDARPPLAVPVQFPTGTEPGTYDKYFEPIHRDLLEHRANVNTQPIDSLRLLSPNTTTAVTIHGVVTLTSPVLFCASFQRFMAQFSVHCQGVVAIDGKVLRRSFDRASGDLQLRIWHIGTHHEYEPNESSWDTVLDWLNAGVKKSDRRNYAIPTSTVYMFADFLVCPTEPFRAGWVQQASVKSAFHRHYVRVH
jgi:hypothetical protein